MTSSNSHQEIKAKEKRIKNLREGIKHLNVLATNKNCEFWTALRNMLIQFKDEDNALCMTSLSAYVKDTTQHLIEAKQYATRRELYDFIIKQVDDANERILDFTGSISDLQDEISKLKSAEAKPKEATRQGV